MAQKVPKYRLHKPSGKAVVTINGRDYYLRIHDSQASKQAYSRLITEWQATGCSASFGLSRQVVTLAMLAADYLDHCQLYYPKKYNSETESVRIAISYLEDYLDCSARDFGPLRLKAVRQKICDSKNKRTGERQSRKYVNRLIGNLIRMFRWAVENELVDANIYHALKSVPSLKRGRCDSPEGRKVKPVSNELVDRTLPHCPPVVADMIKVQRLTGMRPSEVCALTPGMIDRSGTVWIAKLEDHKNAWRDKPREIYIGPKCQAILRPYLLRASHAPLFSPAESEAKRRETRRQARTTPESCGNRPGSNRKKNPKRSARSCYDTSSYRRAIHRACEIAFDKPDNPSPKCLADWRASYQWSPNQLRHAAGTEIRKQYGIEAAQVILGHSNVETTEIYAEIDREKGIKVAAALG